MGLATKIRDEERLTGKAGAVAITGLSPRTVARKLKDPASGFPAPVYILGRRLWTVASLKKWVAAEAAKPRRAAEKNLSGGDL